LEPNSSAGNSSSGIGCEARQRPWPRQAIRWLSFAMPSLIDSAVSVAILCARAANSRDCSVKRLSCVLQWMFDSSKIYDRDLAASRLWARSNAAFVFARAAPSRVGPSPRRRPPQVPRGSVPKKSRYPATIPQPNRDNAGGPLNGKLGIAPDSELWATHPVSFPYLLPQTAITNRS
jgi:hypothetical protein